MCFPFVIKFLLFLLFAPLIICNEGVGKSKLIPKASDQRHLHHILRRHAEASGLKDDKNMYENVPLPYGPDKPPMGIQTPAPPVFIPPPPVIIPFVPPPVIAPAPVPPVPVPGPSGIYNAKGPSGGGGGKGWGGRYHGGSGHRRHGGFVINFGRRRK